MLRLKAFRTLTNGFARGHHFNIGFIDWRDPTMPGGIASKIVGAATTPLFNMYCSSTHLPTKTIETHEIKVQSGVVPIKIAKNVTYNTWKVTFYADELLMIRYFFLRWMELINDTSNHTYSLPSMYKSTLAYAAILSPQDIPVHVYTFRGLFPINVSEVVMQQRDTEVMTYDVEFAYDFFSLNDPITLAIAFGYEFLGDSVMNKISNAPISLSARKLNAPMGISVKIPF